MKQVDNIKFIGGIMLLSFAILGGLIFFLEGFGMFNNIYNYGNLSGIYEGGWTGDSGGGASNTPIFLGLCGLAGAYLLASIKKENLKI